MVAQRNGRNPRVRNIRLSCFAPIVLLLLATPAAAQTTGGYTAPAEFMDLFFDFTGSEEQGYPAGQPTLGQMLTQSVIAKEPASAASGPLVLVMGSDIYVYEATSGARLSQERFRADRASGFYEMTAISHIGPALAYLAQIKSNGDARWQARLASLRTHTAEVRALNRARHRQLARSSRSAGLERAQGADPQHGGLRLRPDIELYRLARERRPLHRRRRERRFLQRHVGASIRFRS